VRSRDSATPYRTRHYSLRTLFNASGFMNWGRGEREGAEGVLGKGEGEGEGDLAKGAGWINLRTVVACRR